MNSGYLNLPSVFACTQLPFEHRDIDMINCLLAKLLVIIQSYCIIFYAQVDVSSESHRNSPKVKHRDKRNEKQLKEKKTITEREMACCGRPQPSVITARH